MFGYYLEMAFRSLRRNVVLTALMVLAIAMGIGASMTTLTVLHILSGDPLPGRSEQLFTPQIDPRDAAGYMPGTTRPPAQVTWIDGMNLLSARRAERQALMTGGQVVVRPDSGAFDPFYEPARYTTADFFPMFGVPLQFGRAWNAADDEARARVVVISASLNEKLFGGKDSTGQSVRLSGSTFRVIGVLGDWQPNPQFYDLNRKSFGENEGVYVPLSTSQDVGMDQEGSVDCWGNGGAGKNPSHTAPCTWLQFWVQLSTPAKADAYRSYLVDYSAQQKALGRFQRPPNVQLRNVQQWLDYNQVVPDDVRLQTWLGFGFLVVCLVNMMGLMLAKFLRRSGEMGIRRALGASRRALFLQLLVESGVIGLAGAMGGLLLALLGLWMVRKQPSEYAALAHLDLAMLCMTFVMSVAASLIAGLLPAWRACQVAPALQLKNN
jgi:putative ABC transport system permease protein